MQTASASLEIRKGALASAAKRDAAFLEKQLAKVPAALHGVMRQQYGYLLNKSEGGLFWANSWLRNRVNSPAMQEAREAGALLDEEETRQLADIKAENTARQMDEKALGKFAASRAALTDDAINKAVSGVPDQYKQLAAVMAAGRAIMDAKIKPGTPADEENQQGFIARAKCPIWWRRNLRKQSAQALDQCHREIGRVKRGLEVYCADVTVQRRRAQNMKNREALEAVLMESDDGIRATLADLADRSTANPELRRIELMVRCRGIESWARQVGYVSDFWTITAPSKYHRFRSDGRSNRAWNRTTPAQVSRYLSKLWARIRADIKNEGLTMLGLRVTEPHHDGTPHWHVLVHCPEVQRERIREIVRKHAMREDADERGAASARFEAVAIDPNRGSATGYVAKYIAKNITGNGHAPDDYEAQDATARTAGRVDAWASCWRIRQFQFFGLRSAPVGLWRACRRIREPVELDAGIEKLRLAADAGDYGEFIARAAESLAALLSESTGELGQYGDLKQPVPIAIKTASAVMPLERREWRMVVGDRSPFGLLSARENREPWSSGNNCTGSQNEAVSGFRCKGNSAKSGRSGGPFRLSVDDEGAGVARAGENASGASSGNGGPN